MNILFWSIVGGLLLLAWIKKPPIPLKGDGTRKVSYQQEPRKWFMWMSIATVAISAFAAVDLLR